VVQRQIHEKSSFEDLSSGRITKDGVLPKPNSQLSNYDDDGYNSDKENQTSSSSPSPSSSPLTPIDDNLTHLDSPIKKKSQPPSPVIRPHHPFPKTPSMPTKVKVSRSLLSPESSINRRSRIIPQRNSIINQWNDDDDMTPKKLNRRPIVNPVIYNLHNPLNSRFDRETPEKQIRRNPTFSVIRGYSKMLQSQPLSVKKNDMHCGVSWIRPRSGSSLRRHSF